MWWIKQEIKESWHPNDPAFTISAIFTGILYYGTISIGMIVDRSMEFLRCLQK